MDYCVSEGKQGMVMVDSSSKVNNLTGGKIVQ